MNGLQNYKNTVITCFYYVYDEYDNMLLNVSNDIQYRVYLEKKKLNESLYDIMRTLMCGAQLKYIL